MYNQRNEQPFTYTGYQKDDVTGTLFAQAREYMPRVGRFTAQDKIAGFAHAPNTLNTYAYCWNQPFKYVDLDGLFLSEIGDWWNNNIVGTRTTYTRIYGGPESDWLGFYAQSTTTTTTTSGGSLFTRNITYTNGVRTSSGGSFNPSFFGVANLSIGGSRTNTGQFRGHLNGGVNLGLIDASVNTTIGTDGINIRGNGGFNFFGTANGRIGVDATIGQGQLANIGGHVGFGWGNDTYGFGARIGLPGQTTIFGFHEHRGDGFRTFNEWGAHLNSKIPAMAVIAFLGWKFFPFIAPWMEYIFRQPVPRFSMNTTCEGQEGVT